MAHLLEHTSISDPPPEAPGSSFPGQTKHLPELGTLSRPAVFLPHQSLPSLRTLGVHFVDIFHPSAPQRYLHVLYCKLWTRNRTIFMLLDTERKSLS